MDEAPMNHALDASSFSEREFARVDSAQTKAKSKPIRLNALRWDSYVRCLFLLAVLALIGLLAWRPILLRSSILLSTMSPSHGDSLAWRPAPAPVRYIAPPKRTPPPEEWRLSVSRASTLINQRPPRDFTNWPGGRMSRPRWQRYSSNPWNWRGDVKSRRRRSEDLAGLPLQKPASAVRVETPETRSGPEDVTVGGAPKPSRSESAPEAISIPAIDQPSGTAPEASATPETGRPHESEPAAATPDTNPVSDAVDIEAGTSPETVRPDIPLSLSDTLSPSGLPVVDVAEVKTPEGGAAPHSTADAPERVEDADWKNSEITAPIPGAYLTIYPKLKFIGLCVPGQGYVRKYHEVAVPEDLTLPKQSAGDGRTPYGRYYIAERRRGPEGSVLVVSWPSPEDARRLGFDAERTRLVDAAWQRHALPPQDSPAGGGVTITARADGAAATKGGFAMEEPQMEELFNAIEAGAWVFVQQ